MSEMQGKAGAKGKVYIYLSRSIYIYKNDCMYCTVQYVYVRVQFQL